MALLNLSAINQLKKGIAFQKQNVISDCFNWPANKTMQPDLFIRISKADVQITNLVSKLALLCDNCEALRQGTDEPWSFDQDGQEMNPLAGIRFIFDTGTDYDLPPTIEQYQELNDLAMTYSQYQKALRQLVQGVRGHYSELTDQGKDTLIFRTALSPSAWAQKEYQQEIADIGIDYCLANYNQFYKQSVALLHSNGDAQQTALSILKLIKSY